MQGLGKSYIVWQEVVDNDIKVLPDTVVNIWKSNWHAETARVTSKGLRTILSACWYLNHIHYGSDWPQVCITRHFFLIFLKDFSSFALWLKCFTSQQPGIVNRTFENRTQSSSIPGSSSIEFGSRTKSNAATFRVSLISESIELNRTNRTQSNSTISSQSNFVRWVNSSCYVVWKAWKTRVLLR